MIKGLLFWKGYCSYSVIKREYLQTKNKGNQEYLHNYMLYLRRILPLTNGRLLIMKKLYFGWTNQ